jgi:hypothetical protein
VFQEFSRNFFYHGWFLPALRSFSSISLLFQDFYRVQYTIYMEIFNFPIFFKITVSFQNWAKFFKITSNFQNCISFSKLLVIFNTSSPYAKLSIFTRCDKVVPGLGATNLLLLLSYPYQTTFFFTILVLDVKLDLRVLAVH